MTYETKTMRVLRCDAPNCEYESIVDVSEETDGYTGITEERFGGNVIVARWAACTFTHIKPAQQAMLEIERDKP